MVTPAPKVPVSPLDRRLLRLSGPRFFSGGFGGSALLEQLQGRQHGLGIPELEAVRMVRLHEAGAHEAWRGEVRSPATLGPLPEAVQTLHFTLRLPPGADAATTPMAVILELVPLLGALPSRLLATRLLAEGIGSVLAVAPWHGARQAGVTRAGVTRTVEDFVLMQRAAALEACALSAWLLAQGHPRVALTGHGLGGALAAHAASVFPIPVAAVPLFAPDTAAGLLLEGALSEAVELAVLTREAGNEEAARSRLRRALEGIGVSGIERRRPAVLLAARRDGWVPHASTLRLAQQLAGAPLAYFPGGHVEGSLRGTALAARAVRDALAELPTLDVREA